MLDFMNEVFSRSNKMGVALNNELTRCEHEHSAPSHVCWTKIMFFELLKRWDQYFSTQDNSTLKSVGMVWYRLVLLPKKWVKTALKGCKKSWIGMVWFGTAILGHS